MAYEWDPVKAEANLRKHGVSFEEATSVFEDPLVTLPNDLRSDYEDRWITIGRIVKERMAELIVAVVSVSRDGTIRIISARRASPANVTFIDDETEYEMPDDFDFTPEQLATAVRGKYYAQAMEAKGFVRLDPEVQAAFPDARAVNEALRALLRMHTSVDEKSAA